VFGLVIAGGAELRLEVHRDGAPLGSTWMWADPTPAAGSVGRLMLHTTRSWQTSLIYEVDAQHSYPSSVGVATWRAS
jgi:hypothetical protein